MKSPILQPLLVWLSLGFIINSFASIQNSLAQREMKFKALAIRDLFAGLVGGLLGVIIVIRGYGVWCLVFQSLSTSLISAVLIWQISSHRPNFSEASFKVIRELWNFSSKIFIFTTFKQLVKSLDIWLIGFIFGAEKLGVYAFAKKLVVQSTSSLEMGLGSFLFTKASRVQEDPQKISQMYILSYKTLNYFTFFTLTALLAFGPFLIPEIFGDKWEGVIPVLWILVLIPITHPLMVPIGHIMKALEKPGWLIKWSILITCLSMGGLVLGSLLGFYQALLGMALGYFISLIEIKRTCSKYNLIKWESFKEEIIPSYLAGGLFLILMLFGVNYFQLSWLLFFTFILGGLLLWCFIIFLLDRKYILGLFSNFKTVG